MRRKWMIPVGIVVGILALAIAAVMIGMAVLTDKGYGMSVGRCLETRHGGYMLVDGNSPISMGDRSENKDLFDGLSSGDKILVIHSLILDTYPGQTDAYYCVRLEEGSLGDISQDVITSLRELGWLETPDHTHSPAAEAVTVDDPVSGYCGNTQTRIRLEGKEYSFMYEDSVELTDILINLRYDAEKVCTCPGEFAVDTEFRSGYEVSLENAFARCEEGQADLTAEQVETIRKILERQT